MKYVGKGMNNSIKKGVVVTVILLFISVSVIPSVPSEQTSTGETSTVDDNNAKGRRDGTQESAYRYTWVDNNLTNNRYIYPMYNYTHYTRDFRNRKIAVNTRINIDEKISSVTELSKNNKQTYNKNPSNRGSDVIYVPDDYPTIQSAVDNATAGDEIIVRNGTYKENIIVDKQLTIRSENGYKNCTIKAKKVSNHVFTVWSNSVSISGFKVLGSEEAGIYLWDANYCNISCNRIYDNIYGIKVSRSHNNTFYVNNLGHFWEGGYWGIWLKDSHNNTIFQNTIAEHHGIGIGIHMQHSNNNRVSNNVIKNNNYGFIIEASSNNNTIANNTVESNHHGGINFYSSYYNSIFHNNINSTYWDGIYLEESDCNRIKSNSFSNDGLFVFYSYHNTIENNTVNGKPLIYLEDESDKVIDEETGEIILVNCENISIQGQEISNVENGIEFWMTCNSTISECKIYSNHFEAIWLAYSHNNKIKDNNLSYSWSGLALYYSENNEICSNKFHKNRWEGIYLDESHLNKIHNNTLIGCDCNGIELKNSNKNDICYNNIFSHIHYFEGIVFYQSKFNNIYHNYIHDNSCGIRFYHANRNSIYDNIISDNDEGVDFRESYLNVVNYNNLEDSAYFSYFILDFLFFNFWNRNYWGEGEVNNIKVIHGRMSLLEVGAWSFKWIQIDWHPAKQPYDIGV